MNYYLEVIKEFVWGLPLIILLIGVGLYLTIRTCFVQGRLFFHALKVVSGKYDNLTDPGEISHFKALMTALSATIGTGNIVGVAVAISMGGPGAVFWMWVTAIVGMATKFTSCTLAIVFRKIDPSGEVHGGPMYYIEMGMGKKFKWLAVLFAFFTVVASFGIGNMFQVKSLSIAVHSLFFGNQELPSFYFNLTLGMILAVIVGSVILGGIRRISAFTSYLVPLMFALYFISGIVILVIHWKMIIPGFYEIFYGAFHAPESLEGGLLGSVIRVGVSRGVFSNESGLGSAPIAHGAARTKEPIREGLVAMLGPFVDTLLVCTITALVIICTGVYETSSSVGTLTSLAFNQGIYGSGVIVLITTILFAFSTLIAWSYYGDRSIDYLAGAWGVKLYRIVYVICVGAGVLLPFPQVVSLSDIFNALMAIPNLIALIVLFPTVIYLLKDYIKREI
jgi:alanine or glycine:cation symporter, AGCS family